MAKISMFLGLFLFVLIAMPTSSSSKYDPRLRCATPWDPEFTCPAGQHPCRSNCGRSRCLPSY
ncbi:hypothetical protein MKX03_003379 [Papaver bracteatum]|nr:hypothetical protein MKX03_003379 [Papaver bracteatum]